MNTKLKSTLEETLQKWVDEQASSDEWADVGYVGDRLAILMSNAAEAVLDSCTDVQAYHDREGNLR